MKLTTWLTALFVLFSLSNTYAQINYSVKGSAIDTAEKKALHNTTIMVLNAKDSTLRKFSRAKADGSFAINNLVAGKFIVVISYPGYADYSENFELDDKNQQHDFGKIDLTLTSRLLKDVIIKGKTTAIKIKGDTTEFNAKAYVIQPNDKVEDLIKQFPGIQVDKDGKITAQGQTVTKVLLDGEEFFGDDPTLVTKNIRADMVDKVQLYDKKSDQATFTGIDDGVKTKTLNIKLKDGKKAGYFGKAIASDGTDKYYAGQLMYNKFQDKEKLSVFGIGSNNGTTGLNWDDAQKYGDGSNMQTTDDGITYFSNNNDLYYDGHGQPKATTGGAHYDNKFDKDKVSVNTNYKIGQLNIDGNQNTITQNNLPDRIINSNSTQENHNSIFRQKLDATFNFTLDTTSNLKVAVDGSYKNNKTNTTTTDTSRRGDKSLLNLNNTSNINASDDHKFDASAFYTKKFKKKGRTLSALFSLLSDESNSTGFLKSNLQYFDSTGVASAPQLIDQRKISDTKNQVFNTNLTYTEPLSKSLAIVFNYGFTYNHSSSDQRAYSKPDGSNDYTVLVDSLSNYFKLNRVSQQAGAIFNYTKGKTTANFGTKVADVSFDQFNIYTGDELKRQFIDWMPQANLTYKFSQQQSLRVGYNGRTIQPSIAQIQPVKDNSNPLYVTVGNADLSPSFSNNFNLSYSSYKVLSAEYFYISANYSFTTNPIVNNTSTDAIGKTTLQYFNLGNKAPHYYSVYTNYGRKIFWGIDAGFNGGVRGSTTYNMIKNDVNAVTQLNTTNNVSYNGSLQINKYAENKYSIYVSAGPTYTINQSSLQNTFNSNGGGFRVESWESLYLPYKFQLGADFNYNYTAKTQALPEGFRRSLLNVNLSKAFFKDKSLKVMGSVNDLLNQNQGFDRNASGGIITEQRYSTIKRYFMLTVSYDFSKMGLGATK